MKPRIELTNEIVKAITMHCPLAPTDNSQEKCFGSCALAGACLEYWTGNNCQNRGSGKMIKCPNCGSTEIKLIDENFDNINNFYDRTYECSCGMGIGTREEIIDTDWGE